MYSKLMYLIEIPSFFAIFEKQTYFKTGTKNKKSAFYVYLIQIFNQNPPSFFCTLAA